MGFISVSIDLSGSTLAKQTLVAVTESAREQRAGLYSEFLRLLYSTERDFYRGLMNRPLFRLQDLYLIKMIGDEFWWVYETDSEDVVSLTAIATAFFSVIMDLFAKDRHLTLAVEGTDFLGQRDAPPLRQFNLPLKAYIDLIDDAIEVNQARYEFLKDVIMMGEAESAAVYRIDDRFTAMCDRLNLGVASATNGHGVAIRRDYIGLEIDRFFRLTGKCRPSLLGVGRNLMDRLPHELARPPGAPDGIGLRLLEIPLRWRDGDILRKYVIREAIPSQSLKGISEDYVLHHVFGASCLGDEIFVPTSGVETLLSPTRAFLAENGFFALNRGELVH